MRVITVSENLELALPVAYPQVVLGCPETLEEVIILYDELRRVVEVLSRVIAELVRAGALAALALA